MGAHGVPGADSAMTSVLENDRRPSTGTGECNRADQLLNRPEIAGFQPGLTFGKFPMHDQHDPPDPIHRVQPDHIIHPLVDLGERMPRLGQIIHQPGPQFRFVRRDDQALCPPARARMDQVPMSRLFEPVEIQCTLVRECGQVAGDLGSRWDRRGKVHGKGSVGRIGDE